MVSVLSVVLIRTFNCRYQFVPSNSAFLGELIYNRIYIMLESVLFI